MWRTVILCGVVLAVSACSSDTQKLRTTSSDERDAAIPAGSNLDQARMQGYMDATDPNAYPPTYDEGDYMQ